MTAHEREAGLDAERVGEMLSAQDRDALAELAELYGTFLMGRFAEVVSNEDEPVDDWQTEAAYEVVDLFAPAAVDLLRNSHAALLDALASAEAARDEAVGRVEALAARWDAADVGMDRLRAADVRAALAGDA